MSDAVFCNSNISLLACQLFEMLVSLSIALYAVSSAQAQNSSIHPCSIKNLMSTYSAWMLFGWLSVILVIVWISLIYNPVEKPMCIESTIGGTQL